MGVNIFMLIICNKWIICYCYKWINIENKKKKRMIWSTCRQKDLTMVAGLCCHIDKQTKFALNKYLNILNLICLSNLNCFYGYAILYLWRCHFMARHWMETSLLLVKFCKFQSLLSTYSLWAGRNLYLAFPSNGDSFFVVLSERMLSHLIRQCTLTGTEYLFQPR